MEIVVMHLQAKEHLGLLTITRSQERHGTDSLSELPERTNTANALILASKTVREYISIILSHQVCGNLLQQPNKT